MRKKINIKGGTVLEYKNNVWHRNGRPLTRKSLQFLTIKDTDGYYKKLTPTGGLAVQDVDNNNNSIKINYIGGNTQESRDKYWAQAPIIRHAVDSVAKHYNINPAILKDRMNNEGFVDQAIKANNFAYLNSKKELKENPSAYKVNDFDKIIRSESNYNKLNSANYNGGFNEFGTDDVATMINEGKVKLINEKWYPKDNENEHKRPVLTANGYNNFDNIGLTAATLKYFRNKAAKDFPKFSRKFLDEAAIIYYNHGEYGGRKIMKNRK